MTYVQSMRTVSAASARSTLDWLIDQVNQDAAPLTITGQRHNAVLVGEDDWQAIQETLHLSSLPGMTASINGARAEGIGAGRGTLDWRAGPLSGPGA